MKMRATLDGDVVHVMVLIKHIMETGLRKDKKTGKFIPAHFINQVVAALNGTTVVEMQWGVAVSQNPFFAFKVKGAKAGDKITIDAVDNWDTKFHGEVVVSA
jgi:sulfur-oxidizing protein SoxZ